MSDQYIKDILNIVENEKGRPIPVSVILVKLKRNHHNINRRLFYQCIDELLETKQINRLKKSGKIVLGYPKAEADMSQIFNGTIYINTKHSGFIHLNDDKEPKFFVHSTNLNGALDGDTVEFCLLKIKSDEDKRFKDAKVLKVLNHKKDYFVGLYETNGSYYEVKCDNEKMYLPIKLKDTSGLVDGSKFLFKIEKYFEDYCLANVKKIIGHKNDVNVDILSIVYDHGIQPEFNDNIINEARQIKLDINQKQRAIRKDLTNLNIVTIDPKTSKDFDDAIYVEKLNDQLYRLYVCIADVSHYIKWQSQLDKQAQQRSCSIYLVDRVIPMLPHNLSDDICSLNPNVERLTLTCQMDINDQGEFKDIQVYPSIIKSHRRFNYDEVNDYFKDHKTIASDVIPETKAMLNNAYELHKILDKFKKQRGYIDFNLPEPIIIVNEKCEPIDITLKHQGEAQKMIEDFMIAANEAVTIFALNKKWPFVYRVHSLPEEAKLKTFAIEAKKLGFQIALNHYDIKSNMIAQWLEKNKNNPSINLFSLILLRTMAKAKYDTKNIGHFGLASPHYTHFTSPIRRYPDLLVHRIFWMYLFDKDSYSDKQRQQLQSELKELCNHCSEKEINAITIEREVNNLKFAQYMQKHIGKEFIAQVTSVTKYGMYVALDNTIEGLVSLSNFHDDFYIFNENTFCLVGKNKKNIFTIGNMVKVRCISSSTYTKKIEFELVKKLN